MTSLQKFWLGVATAMLAYTMPRTSATGALFVGLALAIISMVYAIDGLRPRLGFGERVEPFRVRTVHGRQWVWTDVHGQRHLIADHDMQRLAHFYGQRGSW